MMRPPTMASSSGSRAGGEGGRPKSVATPIIAIIGIAILVAISIFVIIKFNESAPPPRVHDPNLTPRGYKRRPVEKKTPGDLGLGRPGSLRPC